MAALLAPSAASAAALRSQSSTRNQEATLYVGNLDDKVTESLLWELMLQVGPVAHVHIPRDRITQTHQGYGFVEFVGEEDADYALKVMSGVRLFGKTLRLNKSSGERRNLEVGANLFVGNLAPDADEKTLFDTFIIFGTLLSTPKVAREEATGVSKGYAFLAYDTFEAADAAIEAMNGQYLCNRPISVNYAFKKDGRGERHGSAAERLLAAQSKRAPSTSSSTAAGTGGGGPSPALSMAAHAPRVAAAPSAAVGGGAPLYYPAAAVMPAPSQIYQPAMAPIAAAPYGSRLMMPMAAPGMAYPPPYAPGPAATHQQPYYYYPPPPPSAS